jgi:hypothetical protein
MRMFARHIEEAKRWGKIFLEELDTLNGISPGARRNLAAIVNCYYQPSTKHKDLLPIIDAARWEGGLLYGILKERHLRQKLDRGKARKLSCVNFYRVPAKPRNLKQSNIRAAACAICLVGCPKIFRSALSITGLLRHGFGLFGRRGDV